MQIALAFIADEKDKNLCIREAKKIVQDFDLHMGGWVVKVYICRIWWVGRVTNIGLCPRQS